jgi:hypothetical protein
MNGIVRHCSRRTHLVKCKGKVSGSSALQYRAFHASSILGDDNKGGDDGEVPDDFFDDEIEQKKEFLDILRVTEQKIGVENIAAVGESIDWSKIEEEVMSDIRDPSAPSNTEDETASKVLKQLKEKYSTSGVVDKNMHELDENSEGEGEDNFDFSDWKRIVPAEGNSKQVDEGDVFMSSGEDDKESGDNENSNIPGVDKRNPNMTEEVVEHLSSFKNLTQVPPSIMDYTQSHLKTEEVQDEHLNNFMSEHEPSRYRFDKQVRNKGCLDTGSNDDAASKSFPNQLLIKCLCQSIMLGEAPLPGQPAAARHSDGAALPQDRSRGGPPSEPARTVPLFVGPRRDQTQGGQRNLCQMPEKGMWVAYVLDMLSFDMSLPKRLYFKSLHQYCVLHLHAHVSMHHSHRLRKLSRGLGTSGRYRMSEKWSSATDGRLDKISFMM